MMTAPSYNQDSQHNPYPGPRPFGVEERSYFFGRDEETNILTAMVMAQRAVLFFAQSGAGKSSLLHAGLVPALKRQQRSGDRRGPRMRVFSIATVGKGLPSTLTKPVSNIYTFSTLLSLFSNRDADALAGLSLTKALAPYFPSTPSQPKDTTASPNYERADFDDTAPLTTLLILDQFEEIFTQHPERHSEREAFLHQVNEALRSYERGAPTCRSIHATRANGSIS
ncbi:MAG: hypothetical protein AAF629_14775, partial [Chloroflexota bacterium]